MTINIRTNPAPVLLTRNMGFNTVGGDLNRPLAVELNASNQIMKLTALKNLAGVIVLTGAKVIGNPVDILLSGMIDEASYPHIGPNYRRLYAYIGGDVDFVRVGTDGRRIAHIVSWYDGAVLTAPGPPSLRTPMGPGPLLCQLGVAPATEAGVVYP
jgi:hypothetical protein